MHVSSDLTTACMKLFVVDVQVIFLKLFLRHVHFLLPLRGEGIQTFIKDTLFVYITGRTNVKSQFWFTEGKILHCQTQ